MSVQSQLESIVSKVLESHPGIFLVESSHKNQTHEFVLDGDKPLGIYDISDIGRAVNQMADEQMPEESYSLDITSPGADSDLKLIRQFPKHLGREFNVVFQDDNSIKAKLIEVIDDSLVFEFFESPKPKKSEKPIQKTIPFKDIKKTNIILSFK